MEGVQWVKIIGGGGGGADVQYVDGATQATPTGNVALAKNASNVLKALSIDAGGNLNVNLASGSISGGNGAASATGVAVPAQADYGGLNVAGTLRGRTGVNPSGAVYAAQTDLSSVGGASVGLGQGTMAASLPVTIASNQSAVPVSAASLPLPTGAATAAKQPALGTAGAPSADVLTIQGVTSMTPLKTDGSGVTQPVSGAVTANIGTAGSLALDATLTGGTVKAIARGGAKGATSAADITSTASGVNHQPLDVAIYDGAGNLKDPTQIRALTSSDQITVANALLSVSANVTQLGGTAIATSVGNTGAGTARVVQATGSTFNTGQVSVGSTATQIIAANASRIAVTLINNGTVDVFVGAANTVTAANGQKLKGIDGYPMKIRSSSAIWAIVASGTQTISYLEEVA